MERQLAPSSMKSSARDEYATLLLAVRLSFCHTHQICQTITEATLAYPRPTFCYTALEPYPELCAPFLPRCIVFSVKPSVRPSVKRVDCDKKKALAEKLQL